MADTTLYKQIVLEWGQDTDSLIWGMGYSPDNGEHFYVLNTTYGRKYRTEDGDRIWPFIVDKVKAVLDWSNITNKPDLALKTDLTWSNITGKPDVALKSDVAAVSAVASNASAKADSNAKLIAGKASQEDLNSVSSTASSALDKATSNANALTSKVNKSDLVWSNITNRPDFDSIASQASQAVVTANTAESQASAAGQAAASATAQASAAKTTADTATATANAAKASASTASATAASAQQVANSASASASATAVALKSKADTATVNTQFTAVNSNVASAQSTADSAVAGLDNKLDKTALTWGNIANKPTDLATTDSVAKAQSAANSAVSMASGATATANSAKSAATSAVGVANTANTTADSALSKANSAATVANQAKSNAAQAVTTANSANTTANSANNNANQAVTKASNAVNTANNANTTANTANSNANSVNSKVTAIQANGGGRNLIVQSDLKPGYLDRGNGGVNNNGSYDFHSDNYIPTNGATVFTLSSPDYVFKGSGNHTLAMYDSDKNFLGYQLITSPTQTLSKSNTAYIRFSINFTDEGGFEGRLSDWLSTHRYMLEKGIIAHDWSPAPEDIQTQIDQARTDIQSTLTVANNGITAATNLKTTYDNYVQKNDANIKLLGDRITNEVSKITSNGGGRNLWIGSKAFKQCDINVQPVNWNTDSDGITTAHITGTGGFYGRWQYIYAGGTDPFAIGDSATFSVEMKGSGTITIGRENDFTKAVTLTDTWTRYAVSGTVNNANRAHIMYNESGKDCDAYVRLPMVEKGTVAHDWSPAPEDIQTQIDANKTAAANAQTSANNAQTSANSALSKANNAQNTANSAQTSANNAQNTANSAQSTANTAIKVSETLKDLGNYTATASGTTSNSTYAGLPRTSGVSMSRVYNNGYPTPYGNVLNVAGVGSGQLLLGWSGTSSANEHLYYRSHRDNGSGGWSTWDKIAYVSDLTWSNISGKPNVATKSDLTWANISGKPSIPSTFNGTITSTSTDFNSLVTEGHYDIRFSPSTQGKNGPNQSNWGLLDVKVAGRMIVQTYYSDQSNEVYVRNCYDGTWTAWRWVTFWPS